MKKILISLICLCIFYHLLNDYNIEKVEIPRINVDEDGDEDED